jgi:Pyruvate phosphate dikinase, AMP/ATP-binding domain
MDEHQDASGPVLLWLDDARARCPTSVGSKAALLAVVRSHGFLVPDGFVVTGAAYRSAVEAAGIEAALSFPVGLCPNACAESRFRADLLAQAEVPAHVAEAIAQAYGELGRRTGRADPRVAVRASVIGEEATFGPTAPAFIGIVGRAGVTKAVVACWRALFNERAMITRAALRQQFEPEMAVLVQQMVPTLRSGTAYSTDPVRRRPDLVRITATYDEPGPGPLAPIPDVYLVARESNEVAELAIGEQPAGRSPFRHVLTDGEAELVAATAVEIGELVRHPVYMDWSLATGGRVVVLKVTTMTGNGSEIWRRSS